MNRVSIRTLVLMLALLAYFVAYQCLALIPPAKSSPTTCAVRPGHTPTATVNVPAVEKPTAAAVPGPTGSNDTLVLQADEATPLWHSESTTDPNDPADPNDPGSIPEIVE